MEERRSLLKFGLTIIVVIAISFAIITLMANKSSVETMHEEGGRFYLTKARSDADYLSFLENLDESKYEIVDISKVDSMWYITYKIKE